MSVFIGIPLGTWRVAFSGNSERQIKKRCSANSVALCELCEGNLETVFVTGDAEDM